LIASCPPGEFGQFVQPLVVLVFKPEAELFKLHQLSEEEPVNPHLKPLLAMLNHAQLTAVCLDGQNGLHVTNTAVEDSKPELEIFTKPQPMEDFHVLPH